MSSNNGQKIILLEESTSGGVTEEVRASTDVVVHEVFLCLLLTELLQRICPKNVAHEAVCRRLPEAIERLDVLESVKLWAETTVDAKELLVHDGRQRQTAERLQTCLVNLLAVLVLALQFEGEVVGQVTTLMVASQQPKSVGVPDLKRPEVKYTLDREVTTVNVVTQEEVAGL